MSWLMNGVIPFMTVSLTMTLWFELSISPGGLESPVYDTGDRDPPATNDRECQINSPNPGPVVPKSIHTTPS